jgi:hypothetical protein
MKQSGLFFTFVTLALLLTACGASEMNQDKSVLSSLPTAEKALLKGSTRGQYMKPGAPVQLSYTSSKVRVGETSDIQVVLHLTTFDIDRVEVSVSTDPGIVLLDSPGLSFVLPLETGKINYPLSFSASSDLAGLQYINLLVTTTRGDKQLNRAFSIPVQTGSDSEIKAMRKAGSAVEADENGQLVVPMEAEETIN